MDGKTGRYRGRGIRTSSTEVSPEKQPSWKRAPGRGGSPFPHQDYSVPVVTGLEHLHVGSPTSDKSDEPCALGDLESGQREVEQKVIPLPLRGRFKALASMEAEETSPSRLDSTGSDSKGSSPASVERAASLEHADDPYADGDDIIYDPKTGKTYLGNYDDESPDEEEGIPMFRSWGYSGMEKDADAYETESFFLDPVFRQPRSDDLPPGVDAEEEASSGQVSSVGLTDSGEEKASPQNRPTPESQSTKTRPRNSCGEPSMKGNVPKDSSSHELKGPSKPLEESVWCESSRHFRKKVKPDPHKGPKMWQVVKDRCSVM